MIIFFISEEFVSKIKKKKEKEKEKERKNYTYSPSCRIRHGWYTYHGRLNNITLLTKN
jgi:hypothetical protein